MRKIIFEPIIIAFCVWHVFAITVYAMPAGMPQIFQDKKAEIDPVIRPYVLSTSQWQLWNLFSPDPLRQITEYSIALEENGEWIEKRRITGQDIPWYERAAELKLLRRIHEDDTRQQLRKSYLESLCTQVDGKRQRIQMTRTIGVIPKDTLPVSPETWASRDMTLTADSITLGYCP